MYLPNFLRKPLIAALLGAATIAAPVSALYLAGAGRAIATPSTTPTQPTPAAPTVNLAAQLPDFSSMVQHYGPAVVNIAVVTKASAAVDQGDDEDDDGGDNGAAGQRQPLRPERSLRTLLPRSALPGPPRAGAW